MNCDGVMELMQRHVDGDLNAEETSRMLDHVGHCPDCAAMLERLTQLSRGLEQLPRVVPPYSLVDAILPQLENGEAAGAETVEEVKMPAPVLGPRRAARTRKEWAGRLAGVAAVAAVVMLLLIGGPNLLPLGSSDASKEAGSAPGSQASTMDTKESDGGGSDAPVPSADTGIADPNDPVSNAPSTSASPSASGEPSGNANGQSLHTDSVEPASPSPERTPDSSDGPSASASGAAAGEGLKEVEPRPSEEVRDKGIAPPAATEPASPPPTVMMMQQPPDEDVLSPDGQWRAVIREGLLQLLRTSDGSLAYETPAGDGKRSGIAWKEDSSAVDYTLQDADGNSTAMYVDVSELQERKAP